MTSTIPSPADHVRRIRTALGLTQAEFGRLIGTHPNTVSRLERGDLPITPARAAALTMLARQHAFLGVLAVSHAAR